MADDRLETLRKVSLFEGLTDRELEAVAHAAKERRFDTGDTVVVEGEGGVGFFVVAEGTARVEARGERLGTISRGGLGGSLTILWTSSGAFCASKGRRPAIAVVGTPDQVRESLLQAIEETGARRLVVESFSAEESRLLATEVLPALHEAAAVVSR